jgi:mycothiol synthase
MAQQWPQLIMERPNLDGLPAPRLPEHFRLRSFEPGDEAAWVGIINEAFDFSPPHPPTWFHERLGDGHFRPERVWFAVDDTQPVATASAWIDERWGEECGVLHMVGAKLAYRGLGLGKAVCVAALGQMAVEGRTRARLLTDDFRRAAIRVYTSLGFEPVYTHDSHRARWWAVLSKL